MRWSKLLVNASVSALSSSLGLPCGVLLNHLFVVMLTAMPLEVDIRPLSYILSCAITLLFAQVVNWIIGRKTREIDMLGALKSVE